ncbi:MAG: AbrB/MazE/SpoVT family DNA-binding domain-containing protein [Candidatus Saccharimonadales bacterium]|jgi:antitoxin component of MazEF toxin-antitoxin module
MTITTTQKLIKIGTSQGITLPAKELKALGVKPGEELEVIVRKKTTPISDGEVTNIASDILSRYKDDFHNLAQR